MRAEDNNKEFRWENDIQHDPRSQALYEFMASVDEQYNEGFFQWKAGGGGDNGEELMYALDCFFFDQDQLFKRDQA